MKHWLEQIRQAVPADSKAAWLSQAAGLSIALSPRVGLVAKTISDLQLAGLSEPFGTFGLVAMGAPLGAFYLAKGYDLFRREEAKGIWFGEAFIPIKALWTSILITGRPGTGKTSAAIFPPLEQILRMFNGADYIVKDGQQIENEFARIGGVVFEVKGEFNEGIGYCMDNCGRNVFEDFHLIRPDNRIPVAMFEDPETKYVFYLNAMPCSTASEAGLLLRHAQRNVPLEDRIREDIWICEENIFFTKEPELYDVTFPTEGQDVRYIGWREDGDELVRVSHTPEYHKPLRMLDKDGREIRIKKPKKLRYVTRILVSNGLLYNFIDPNVGAAVAAEKLARMAEMSGGESRRGNNGYWYNNAHRLITNCITLCRTLRPNQAVQCGDIYRLVALDDELSRELKALVNVSAAKKQEQATIRDADKAAEIQTRVIDPLTALNSYFVGEWTNLDQKLKGTIKTVVSNTFQNFVTDPGLKETFSSRPTFNFDDCAQKGHLYCFVPGTKYEPLAKPIGTGLKIDFQASAMQRIQRADMNKARPLMNCTDECWNWVVIGSSAVGDPPFLAQCRQSRVLNLLATQNYDQFIQEIGREGTNGYLSCFGVYIWLQNFNEATNKLAETLMEPVKRAEYLTTSGGQDLLDALNLKGEPMRIQMRMVEQKLFRYSDFVRLRGSEAIVFNGYVEDLCQDMAVRTELPKSYLTAEKTKPKIADFMREYSRGYLEQAVWKDRIRKQKDHQKNWENEQRQKKKKDPNYASPKYTPIEITDRFSHIPPTATVDNSKTLPAEGPQTSPSSIAKASAATTEKNTTPIEGGHVTSQRKSDDGSATTANLAKTPVEASPRGSAEAGNSKSTPKRPTFVPPAISADTTNRPSSRSSIASPIVPNLSLHPSRPKTVRDGASPLRIVPIVVTTEGGTDASKTKGLDDSTAKSTDKAAAITTSGRSLETKGTNQHAIKTVDELLRAPLPAAAVNEITPAKVELESQQYVETSKNLSTAAAMLVLTTDTNYLRTWLANEQRQLALDLEAGHTDERSAGLMAGPQGVAIGDPSLRNLAVPPAGANLTALKECENARVTANGINTQVDRYTHQTPPTPYSDDLFATTN